MLNMSSAADSKNFLKILRTSFLKEDLPIDVPHFIKEHLWMSVYIVATLKKKKKKKKIGGSKPSSKLTLKTNWYHSCGCSDDSQSYVQMRGVLQINIFFFKVRL